jgi:hypothetical protein
MDSSERTHLIHQYREGVAAVESALAAAGESRLDAHAEPGEWSAREIVHHLADSEMTSAIRLRKLIAEDSPTIQGYDEPLFAQRLFYDRPIEPSLQAFRAARATTADILERLSDDDWSRAGTHTEWTEPYTVEAWLITYVAHAKDHADQIRRAAGIA